MTVVATSVEEYISNISFDGVFSVTTSSQSPDVIDKGLLEYDTSISVDSNDLRGDYNSDVDKNEFDVYLSKDHSQESTNACNDIFSESHHCPTQPLEINGEQTSVPLSCSVGVPYSNLFHHSSKPVQVVNDLEEEYKPRYKSDYFSQDGTIRKPRYVADRYGNHYVTLKVAPNSKGLLRVDWTTIEVDKNNRYSMPYKFQINNKSSATPDCNPFYANFSTDGSGIVVLYLTLIKLKQDHLKPLQPLTPFPPIAEISSTFSKNNSKQTTKLSPKQLIEKYQLKNSQIAFTLCELDPVSHEPIEDWSTTVYSTVIREKINDDVKTQQMQCPHCKHLFTPTTKQTDDIHDDKPVKKRKHDPQKKQIPHQNNPKAKNTQCIESTCIK